MRLKRYVSAIMAMAFAAAGQGRADEWRKGHQRTQEISLQKGWNAVFLEVQPLDESPAKVFGGMPVDKVASLFGRPVSNQFVVDREVDLYKGQGWGVWYAPGLPGAFLGTLSAIDGNRAYLVHATRACQWRVSGRVLKLAADWQPDSYNLVGFPVRSPGGPTFEEFFAGSRAHRGQAIYRLVEGRWKLVLEPAAEVMRSGEAFWIYCDGPSDFEGPLRVETLTREGLSLGRGGGRVVLRNDCPHALTPTVHHVPGGGAPVPLSILVRVYGDPEAPVSPRAARMPAGGWQQALPSLEVEASMAVPFECRTSEMAASVQGSLLKITTDIGTETWVPVIGRRPDLSR